MTCGVSAGRRLKRAYEAASGKTTSSVIRKGPAFLLVTKAAMSPMVRITAAPVGVSLGLAPAGDGEDRLGVGVGLGEHDADLPLLDLLHRDGGVDVLSLLVEDDRVARGDMLL